MTDVPDIVQRQWAEMDSLKAKGISIDRSYAESHWPELIAWVNANISLVDIIRASGIELEPLSPDSPGVFVGKGGCPGCGEDIIVKGGE